MNTRLNQLPRRLLASAIIVLTLAAFFFAQAAPAMAGPRVRTSIGVSCSMSNGVATVKVKVKATGVDGATVDNLLIDIDLTTSDSPPEHNSSSDFDETVILSPAAVGSYTILIQIDATGASDKTRTGTATVTATSCSVRVG